MPSSRQSARRLANNAVNQGQPLSWFEALYSQADGDRSTIPWADMAPNPNLAKWLERQEIEGRSRSALVIGCGLGDDPEALASIGFNVTAFDISPTCVEWCVRRFPDSPVRYIVADLFDGRFDWTRTFDFVFEAYTLQVLPPDLRRQAMENIADCVAPEGTLLVITRGRNESDQPGEMPWPLLRSELDRFVEFGLSEVRVEDYIEAEDPPVRRFRAEYRNAGV